MRKKTIGDVLRLARINQGMSLDDLKEKTDIQVEFLEALESDDFDLLPSPFYARSFLKKYAWAVDLDENIVLEAYEEGSMIAYDEVEVDEKSGIRSRRERKKQASYLPIVYFTLISLAILVFVSYYAWTYVQDHPLHQEANSAYSVVSSNQAASKEEGISSGSETSSSSSSVVISVTGGGDLLNVTATDPSESTTVTFSVENTSSWISMTGTDLEGGVTLSPENKTATATLSKGATSTITLGVVEGVTIAINGQKVDLSQLTSQTGVVVLTINE